MARPKKPGLDYFPKDVNFYSDRKIRRLLSKHGLNSLIVYDYLLCLIYSENGYYIENDADIYFDIKDGLNNLVSEEFVEQVLTSCLKFGLLSIAVKEKHNKLTSKGIQERYLQAKRRAVINKDFDVTETKKDNKESEPPEPERQPRENFRIPHAKDKYKDGYYNKDNLRAFAFIQQQKPVDFEQRFKMVHWRYIKDKKKFVNYFDNIVDEKKMDYDPDVLIPRLCRLADTWKDNQQKTEDKYQSATKQTTNIPTNE